MRCGYWGRLMDGMDGFVGWCWTGWQEKEAAKTQDTHDIDFKTIGLLIIA
jgi:hypothetical protein